MTPAARLASCIQLTASWIESGQRLDVLMQKFFRGQRFIGAKDRASIAQQTYRIARHYARLNWWLAYLTGHNYLSASMISKPQPAQNAVFLPFDAQQHARALTLLECLLLSGIEHQEAGALFSGARFAPEPLNGDEQKFFGLVIGRTLDHPDMPEEVKLECPAWAAAALKASLGDDFASEMKAQMEQAPFDLRVNALLGTREELQAELAATGLVAEIIPLTAHGLRFTARVATGSLPCLRDGRAEVQDAASQRVAALVGAAPGMQVLDLCAGAGGKTLAMAAGMENKGQIFACDVLAPRLTELKRRAKRAGAQNIQSVLLNTELPSLPKALEKKQFDRVLVDAPCSGSGTWRRNPDARWTRRDHHSWEENAVLQQKLLQQALTLVKPKGRVVYATCSLADEENRQVVAASGAHIVSEHRWLAHRDGGDGFYAAILSPKS